MFLYISEISVLIRTNIIMQRKILYSQTILLTRTNSSRENPSEDKFNEMLYEVDASFQMVIENAATAVFQ